MCQEMIQKLKLDVKNAGQHKQRVFINVTLEGLKIIDGIAMVSNSSNAMHVCLLVLSLYISLFNSIIQGLKCSALR